MQLAEAKVVLGFSMELATEQVANGRYFVYEQPWAATSWKDESVTAAKSLPGVTLVKGNQCVFGQQTIGPDGEQGLVAKPTGWLTNSPEVAKRVGLLRQGGHEHVHLLEGRAKAAEKYPTKLVKAILRGIKAQLGIGAGLHALDAGHNR